MKKKSRTKEKTVTLKDGTAIHAKHIDLTAGKSKMSDAFSDGEKVGISPRGIEKLRNNEKSHYVFPSECDEFLSIAGYNPNNGMFLEFKNIDLNDLKEKNNFPEPFCLQVFLRPRFITSLEDLDRLAQTCKDK